MSLEINSVYCGNCLDVMTHLDTGSIDMILCDLPYGTTQNKWDSIIPFKELWTEYRRVCKSDAAIVLTAAQPFTSALVMSNVRYFKQALVWKKNVASNFLNANRQHLARHEDVILFSYGSPVYNKQMQPGTPYKQKRSGKDDSGSNYGKVNIRVDTINEGERAPITVLEYDREIGMHPTQKPVALFEYLIKTYSNPGDLILDNCAGSGTTAIAAINTDRNYILIEQSEEYVNTIINRLA